MRENNIKHKYFSAIDSVDGTHYIIERIDGKELPSPRGKKSNLTHMETWEPDRPSPDPARWIDCMAFYEAFGIDDPPIEYEELIPMLQEAAKKKGYYLYPVYFKMQPGKVDEYCTDYTGNNMTGGTCGIMLFSFEDMVAHDVTDPEAVCRRELEEYANWFAGRAAYYNLYRDGRFVQHTGIAFSDRELQEEKKWDYLGEFTSLEECYQQCQKQLHVEVTPQKPLWERIKPTDDFYERERERWCPRQKDEKENDIIH